jgi:hypothetical protein
MRLTLTDNEIERVLKYIALNETEKELFHKILEQIEVKKARNISMKQHAATIARATKSEMTKNKVLNAILHLQLENKKTTMYAICKKSGVCFNTVKKYLTEFNLTK